MTYDIDPKDTKRGTTISLTLRQSPNRVLIKIILKKQKTNLDRFF